MLKRFRLTVLLPVFLALLPAALQAEYSAWSFFGGLNLIYNSDGAGVSVVPGMREDGTPGGLDSAPSPLVPYFGAEYRFHIPYTFGLPEPLPLYFAPSASFYTAQYLYANDRALPAEIENRTAYVLNLFLDLPVLYTFEKDRFLFSLGAGPAIVTRWAFLESGVPSDAQNEGEKLNAGDQVDAVNEYFWQSGRWFYPTVQAGVRYELETGWGGGFTLRVGIPVFNLWSTPEVPFQDSIMIMAALVITPPVRNKSAASDASTVSTDNAPKEPLPAGNGNSMLIEDPPAGTTAQ